MNAQNKYVVYSYIAGGKNTKKEIEIVDVANYVDFMTYNIPDKKILFESDEFDKCAEWMDTYNHKP